MGDRKRRTLRIAAAAVALICLVLQVYLVGTVWLSFDPGVTCGRQLSWGDWIECLQETHSHVQLAELAFGTWAVAAVGLILGRFLPPYVSMLIPIGAAALVTLGLTEYWRNEFGIENDENIVMASTGTLTSGAVVVGPVVAGWLWGLCNRGRRQAAVRLATAFD
jgi:hypothetical protein